MNTHIGVLAPEHLKFPGRVSLPPLPASTPLFAQLPICWRRPHTQQGAGRPRGSGAAQRVSSPIEEQTQQPTQRSLASVLPTDEAGRKKKKKRSEKSAMKNSHASRRWSPLEAGVEGRQPARANRREGYSSREPAVSEV